MEMAAAMGGYGTWFTSHLLRLIAKADPQNRELLRLEFPDHVAAFERWRTGVGEFAVKENA
jgi:hypothetical protein